MLSFYYYVMTNSKAGKIVQLTEKVVNFSFASRFTFVKIEMKNWGEWGGGLG